MSPYGSGMELGVWEITLHMRPAATVGIMPDSPTAGRAECITADSRSIQAVGYDARGMRVRNWRLSPSSRCVQDSDSRALCPKGRIRKVQSQHSLTVLVCSVSAITRWEAWKSCPEGRCAVL